MNNQLIDTREMISGGKTYYIFYGKDSTVVKVKFPNQALLVGTYSKEGWDCKRPHILRPDVRDAVEALYC